MGKLWGNYGGKMNAKKIIYYASTALISLMLLAGAINFILNYTTAREEFLSFGFPVWIIYPLAAAKALGSFMLWVKHPECAWLREWAYAGIAFNLLLALGAHLSIADGKEIFPIVALFLVVVSRVSLEKLKTSSIETSSD